MSDTFTTTTIAGYVGGDAELKHTTSGTALMEFSLPVKTEGRGGKEAGTMWVRCVLFGQRAEKMVTWVEKGKFVIVTGRMVVREYEKKDGSMGFSVDMNMNELGFGPRQSEGQKRQEDSRQTQLADDDIPF
jgi:single-strand DNA-binding protein